METWLKNEGFHQYLVVPTEDLKVSGFALNMLLHYPGGRLLPVSLQYQNETGALLYETSGAETLEELYETREMDCAGLRLLFQSVWDVCRELEEYLLLPEGLLLSPKYIYYRPDKKEFRFCYYPDADGSFMKGMRDLAEFCMKCTNHQDEDAVLFIYGLYRLLQEDSIEPTAFQSYLKGAQERVETSAHAAEPEPRTSCPAGQTEYDGELRREGSADGESGGTRNGKPEERGSRRWMYVYGATAAAAGGFGIAEGVRYLCMTHGELDGKLCIIAIIAGIVLAYSAARYGRAGRPGGQRRAAYREETPPICVDTYEKPEGQAARIRSEPDRVQISPDNDRTSEETTVLGAQTQTPADARQERPCWRLNSQQEQTESICLFHLPGVIGRKEEEVEYYVGGEGVSRKHLLLFQSGGNIYAEDLASTNGSYINGVRLKPGEPSLLQAKDILAIGPYRYSLSCEGAEV